VLDWLFFVPVAIALSLVWALLALFSAVWSVQYVREGLFLYGLLSLVLPGVMLASLMHQAEVLPAGVPRAEVLVFGMFRPSGLLEPAMHAGDVAHFFVVKPSYDKIIAMLPNDGSRFDEFNWGGLLFASKGVVYDETDQIAMPKDRRSAAWLARVGGGDLMCGGSDLVAPVQPLWSHYYVAGFGC
jgi:hypothetical protein